MNNPEYIKFVLSRVETDLAGYSSSSEYGKVAAILGSMKSADNILREAFILTGIKKLRKLAFYIIFMYKKSESNRITIDNFLENYKTDKEFLFNYLQTYYNLETTEAPETEETAAEIFNIDALHETDKEAEIYSLSESKFRIETLESKLVNEEFIESNPLSNLEISDDGYMRLVETDGPDAVAGKPPDIPEEGDVFSLPVKSNDTGKQDLQKTAAQLQGEETKPESDAEIKSKSLADFFEQLDSEEKSWLAKTNKPGSQTPAEKIPQSNKTVQKNDSELNTETVNVSNIETHEYGAELKKPALLETDSEIDGKLKEIEKETSEEIINSDFIRYETELYMKNDVLRNTLDELIIIANAKTPDYTKRDILMKELCDTSRYLKEKSELMSFEIIMSIYDSIVFCFSQKFRDIVVSEETISIFREAVNGVEKLVRGDEIGSFSNTIKKVEKVEKELKQLLELREEYEKKKYDFGEEERKIMEEFKDNSEKEAYLHLRDKILELEKIFDTHLQAKEKLHPFESLRKLSTSFTVFREIVNVSGILEMTKLARLAEAGYVFVKFIQNYRLDPFKDDVIEVFRFMIYSFKLIYLDKPVKELDVFISYLNDPVKIFHQKNKPNE